ncbi:hypothetical protein HGRIS_014197 [Hohenbuehelia grisea]|uniref:Uncharacterized protein n=1 Tax=Hohenbuehelia grisea TaxID=104357 RepID=A0ABR3JTG1_9AGAR
MAENDANEESAETGELNGANASSGAPEPEEEEDESAMKKALTRNWAKGERLTFLTAHIGPYREACLRGCAKGREYLENVVNEYFKRFHWRLPLKQDPSPDDTYDHDEALSSQDKKKKGNLIAQMKISIPNWIQYRAQKTDTTLQNLNKASSSDPFAILLGNLTGLGTKPDKLRCGWQQWLKQEFDSYRDEFDKLFKASGLPASKRASERNKFAME